MAINQKITPEIVQERINKIIELSVQPNTDFELTLVMKQLSNWSQAKRRQVFRGVLKFLLTKTGYTYNGFQEKILISRGSKPWCYNINTFRQRALERIVKLIQVMAEEKRFILEKVLTISKVNSLFFTHDPKIINYLFKNNIVIIGNKFNVAGENTRHLKKSTDHLPWITGDLQKHYDILVEWNLNPNILMDPKKFQMIIASRIIKNIQIFSDIISNMQLSDEFCKNQLIGFIQILSNLNLELNLPIEKIMSKPASIYEIFEKKIKKLNIDLITEEDMKPIKQQVLDDLLKVLSDILSNILSKTQDISKLSKDFKFNPYEVSLAIR